ncbi:MAG: 4Fe-4S dicluster domain-containing protein [Candidatus Latescibacteria bacterium]|nr:4Fe-4S dicluster domain-containing protein [bacterium]MBD3424965.1 4Fe-4S dicluster domain-containing protein [Candidatus Latescibacterota bacterium]
MTSVLRIVDIAAMGVLGLFFLLLALFSLSERRYRAAVVSALLLTANGIFWIMLIYWLAIGWVVWVNLAIIILGAVFAALSLMSWFPSRREGREVSGAERYDERDQMFARNNLRNHPGLREKYYRDNPDRESIDREILRLPEFGQPGHTYYHRYATPVYQAAFEFIERSIPVSSGEPAPEKREIDPEKLKEYITDAAIFYGACDVGFTPIRDYHLYSRAGRHAEGWGEEISTDHRTAIVIALRMDIDMIKEAPTGRVIQESFRKYVEAAKVSDIIAAYIRQFGYRARAHNDANYQTLCVPLAVDAGLGELGRMGVLIHRKYGPLVRLAVVTTELELSVSPSVDLHIEDFCMICRKCSDNCPTSAISGGDEPVSRGFRHWSVSQEECYRFWKKIGTDCGVCLSVCPYSKPDSFIHRLVRFYISRNRLNQRIALLFDDLLYGRRKKINKKNPEKIFPR